MSDNLLAKYELLKARFDALNTAVNAVLDTAAATLSVSASSDIGFALNALEDYVDTEWSPLPDTHVSTGEAKLRAALGLSREAQRTIGTDGLVLLRLVIDALAGQERWKWPALKPVLASVSSTIAVIRAVIEIGGAKRPDTWMLFYWLPDAARPATPTDDYDPRDDCHHIIEPLADIEATLREEYEQFDNPDLPALSLETLDTWRAAYPGIEMELSLLMEGS